MRRTFCYFRLTRTDEPAEHEIEKIRAAGFDTERCGVVTESVTGSMPAMDRKEFQTLTDQLEPNDQLIVTKLEDLGRDLKDVLFTIDRITGRGVRVYCLALSRADLAGKAGKRIIAVMRAITEFEHNLRNESIRASLKRASAGGILLGRPYALSREQHVEIWARRAQGASLNDLAKEFGVSRAMIQRVEKRGPGTG